MKSFLKVMLVVLSVVGMTASLAAVAQGDTLYASSATTGEVIAFDMAGTPIPSQSFSIPNTDLGPYGLAHSPDNAYLYAGYESTVAPTDRVAKYDIANGTLLADLTTAASDYPFGLGIDSAGNVYAGTLLGIDKIAPDGTIYAGWGTTSGQYIRDLEVYDGYLYAVTQDGAMGVFKWALGAGGAATTVVTTPRCDGIAFGPDGTPYTSHRETNTGSVREWTSDFSSFTEIGTNLGRGSVGVADVDYFDGDLYVPLHKNGILKGVLNGGTWTWTTFVSPDDNYYYEYVDIVVPEPGTLALLVTGLIGLLCYAWRKRK